MRAIDKRRALAPPPLPSASDVRLRFWVAVILATVGFAAAIAVALGYSPWLLVLAGPGVAAVYVRARRGLALWQARRWARRSGRAGVLITSRSPIWQQYVERVWVPRCGDRVAVLNWSDRRSWAGTERALLRIAGRREFCPAIVVIRVQGEPLVFRFSRAFRAYKHGNEAALRQLEAEAFAALDAAEDRPGGRPG